MGNALNMRLQNHYDSYSNWVSLNPLLLPGEAIFGYIDRTNGDGVVSRDILIKVGDGTHRFNELKTISALSADVNSYAKLSSTEFATAIENFITNSEYIAELKSTVENNDLSAGDGISISDGSVSVKYTASSVKNLLKLMVDSNGNLKINDTTLNTNLSNINTSLAGLQSSISANAADIAALKTTNKTVSTDNITQGTKTLILRCGNSVI